MISNRFPRVAAPCLVLVCAASPVLASEEGGGGALITPQIGTIFWTLITFILLVVVLGKYAWKPLLGALDERQRSIEESLRQAEKEKADAAKLVEEHKALVAQAHRERAESVAAGQRDAEALKAEILEQARQQRDQLLKQTEEQVQAGIVQAQSKLRVLTADMVIKAAEKLLARNLDDATQRKLVEDYLTDLEKSSIDSSSSPEGPPVS